MVTLSVDDAPVSEDVTRSGADGGSGPTVSITREVADEVDETLFCASVRTDVRVHVPSASAGREHDSIPGDTTYEHDTVVDPFVAVIVTVSPVFAPLAPASGVASLVTASLPEEPVSDVAVIIGADVAAMAVTVTDTVEDDERLRMSDTEYDTGVTIPVKPPSGVKTIVEDAGSMDHVPSPGTVLVVSVHAGATSTAPQSLSDEPDSPVPVSLRSGETRMSPPAAPVAVSALDVGDGGIWMVAVIDDE